MEHKRSQLDTFARKDVGRCGRILKRGVGCEARPAIRRGVEAFKQERLIRPHVRHVEPAMCGIEPDRVVFTHPILIYEVCWNKVTRCDRPSVANRKRGISQWSADWAP